MQKLQRECPDHRRKRNSQGWGQPNQPGRQDGSDAFTPARGRDQQSSRRSGTELKPDGTGPGRLNQQHHHQGGDQQAQAMAAVIPVTNQRAVPAISAARTTEGCAPAISTKPTTVRAAITNLAARPAQRERAKVAPIRTER